MFDKIHKLKNKGYNPDTNPYYHIFLNQMDKMLLNHHLEKLLFRLKQCYFLN
jgi:hypothetical protein